MTTEKLSGVGQIEIESAKIVSYKGIEIDITSMIGELSIFEDIFSNTLTGHILLEDSLDLIKTVPLIGQEQFNIELKTPTISASIKKTFYIYKLQHRKSEKRVQTYMLNFCSKELIYSVNTKISKSFSGLISDTVSRIFKGDTFLASNSQLLIEPTQNSYKFCAAYWNPLETINWVASKAINSRGASNYLFFETHKSFEFTSVDDLIYGRRPLRSYIYSDVDANTSFGTTGDKDQKYNTVKSIQTPVTFDYLRSSSGGMFSGKLFTYDMTTKNINSHVYDYIDDFDKTAHLETYPMKTSNLVRKKVASLYHLEKNNYLGGAFKSQDHSKYFLQRNSLMEQLSAFKIVIEVPGRLDIKAGSIINFTIPEFRQFVQENIDTEIKNDFYSGKYLVTAIRHQIINSEHTMYMEIITDSFVKKLITGIPTDAR